MLNGIIGWSLHHRFFVIVGTVAFVFVGVFVIGLLNVDAFPDTTPIQVQINTLAPGLAPEEMERQITYPVEQAISGMPRLEQMRSISRFGLSQVVVTLRDDTDIYFARQLVNERLQSAAIPEGLNRPTMGPVATGIGEVFHYLVSGTGHDLADLRTIHDWTIKPVMRTVPGTAEINSWGGEEREYQIRIDPTRLIKFDLTFDQVTQAVRANNFNVGGGNLARAGEMLLIHGIARTNSLAQIGNIVIAAKEGVPIRVRDVADVELGHAIRLGAVTAEGKGEVVLGLGFMLMGENSHAVTWRLKQKFDEVKKNLPAGVVATSVYDRTELIDHVIDTVRKNLSEGGLLVIAVLFIFLGNLRAGLVVALAIPLSMLFAFCGMWPLGIAASLLSLGALDFGLVVDSSVVMIENIMRHLAMKTPEGGEPRSHLEVVRDAAIEVRTPTMFGELIIMIVYLPILTLQGVEGKLFRPMALTVIFALAGSLVLSLTIMPVLASLLLPRTLSDRPPWVVRTANWIYKPIVEWALRSKWTVLTAAVLSLVLAVSMAVRLGSEFVPKLSEGALVVGVTRLAGTDLNESLRTNSLMERTVRATFPDEVEHVWSRCGTAEVATDPMGVESADFFITLKPRERWKKAKTQDELVELIKHELKDIPGQNLAFTQPIEQRLNEMISGARADVAVKIFGDDFTTLAGLADQVGDVLKNIEGGRDVSLEQLSGQPVLQVRVKQDEIARYGVPAKAVLDLVEAIGGKQLGEVMEGQLRFPLTVRLPERYRASPEAIGSMVLATASGERIPLSRLASLDVVEGPASISRELGQRRTIVQCNVRGRDVGSFVAEAQRAVKAKLTMPSSRYHLEWGGQFENLERARNRLLIVVPVALALIVALLYLTYGRLRDVVLVFTAVPFASVGGIAALTLREMPFSISAGIGFIALSGVSVLNSMVLVTFIRQLQDAGIPLKTAIEEAARERLRPVLMTALVASLGFAPMAFSTSMGAEVQRPLATVVIGGVLTSTAMTLLVLPVLYEMFGMPTKGEKAAH